MLHKPKARSNKMRHFGLTSAYLLLWFNFDGVSVFLVRVMWQKLLNWDQTWCWSPIFSSKFNSGVITLLHARFGSMHSEESKGKRWILQADSYSCLNHNRNSWVQVRLRAWAKGEWGNSSFSVYCVVYVRSVSEALTTCGVGVVGDGFLVRTFLSREFLSSLAAFVKKSGLCEKWYIAGWVSHEKKIQFSRALN